MSGPRYCWHCWHCWRNLRLPHYAIVLDRFGLQHRVHKACVDAAVAEGDGVRRAP